MYQNITNFLQNQRNFWFGNPGSANLVEVVFWGFLFALIILIGIGLLAYNRWKVGKYPPKNKMLKLLGYGPIYIGLLGFVFLFFRWQGIDFLGVRFFLALILIISIVWILFFTYFYRKKVPEEILQYETRLVKKKYLRGKGK